MRIMKTTATILIQLLWILSIGLVGCGKEDRSEQERDYAFQISSSPELNRITNTWANCYTKINPEMKIRVATLGEMPGSTEGTGDPVLFVMPQSQVENANVEYAWSQVVGHLPGDTDVQSASLSDDRILALTRAIPAEREMIGFIKWMLTRGQVLLDNYGYAMLTDSEELAAVKLMNQYESNIPAPVDYSGSSVPIYFNIYFLGVMIFLFLFLGVALLGYLFRKAPADARKEEARVPGPIFNEGAVLSMPGLYYDKTHTWTFMEQDGKVKIGIDDFLQHVTGSLTRIKMKGQGESIKKGKPFLSIIQDGKQLDISAPVSGTVIKQNKALMIDTGKVNASPYEEGWVYVVEPTNWVKEVQFLFMESRYKEWLKGEFTRLKEFISSSLRPATLEYAHVLQDGGELRDGILEDFGPEVWEDFQEQFINQ